MIQPGVVYMADKWQFALEAVIPINGPSGHGVGVEAELDFFLDDIFPTQSASRSSQEPDNETRITRQYRRCARLRPRRDCGFAHQKDSVSRLGERP